MVKLLDLTTKGTKNHEKKARFTAEALRTRKNAPAKQHVGQGEELKAVVKSKRRNGNLIKQKITAFTLCVLVAWREKGSLNLYIMF